jgi:tRNA uridine 5-carbamoylmethylation protein Kti12
MQNNNLDKVFVMLTGVPGSGKSFFIKNSIGTHFPNYKFTIISSDNIIEERAASQGKTYSDVFKAEIKSAIAEMHTRLADAIKANNSIIWDQTNLTKKIRRSKIASIPDEYTKVSVFFPTPTIDELNVRLASRPGKTIPPNIVLGMISQLEQPSIEEGFDSIIIM